MNKFRLDAIALQQQHCPQFEQTRGRISFLSEAETTRSSVASVTKKIARDAYHAKQR